jgi:hypothetical protein
LELFENWPPPGKVKTLSTFAATDNILAAKKIWCRRIYFGRHILEEKPENPGSFMLSTNPAINSGQLYQKRVIPEKGKALSIFIST